MTERPSPDQTPQGWDQVVPVYEQAAEGLTGLFVEQALTMAGVGPGDKVLDVAAGPGVMTVAIAHRGADVLGTDFAPKMVERLRQRAAAIGLSNVSTAIMDGQALEVADGSFDRACSNFGLIHFPDPDQGLREMHRVLKPGGRAVVTAWSWAERFEPLQVFMGAVRRAVPDYVPAEAPVYLRFQDPTVLRQSLDRAGFAEVKVQTVPGLLSVPSSDWLKENLLKANFFTSSQFTEEQKARILDHTGQMLKQRFGDTPPKLSMEAHIGLGTKG